MPVNPAKEKRILVHVAHRGTAYFGLASTLRAAREKLDKALKGTGLTSTSPNVQTYEIRYNPKTGEGWSSKI